MYQTAVEMASANPTGPAPSYKDVAARLNESLASLVSNVAPAPTDQAPANPTVAAKPILRNNATQAQPSPGLENQPASYHEYAEQLRHQVLARYGIK